MELDCSWKNSNGRVDKVEFQRLGWRMIEDGYTVLWQDRCNKTGKGGGGGATQGTLHITTPLVETQTRLIIPFISAWSRHVEPKPDLSSHSYHAGQNGRHAHAHLCVESNAPEKEGGILAVRQCSASALLSSTRPSHVTRTSSSSAKRKAKRHSSPTCRTCGHIGLGGAPYLVDNSGSMLHMSSVSHSLDT